MAELKTTMFPDIGRLVNFTEQGTGTNPMVQIGLRGNNDYVRGIKVLYQNGDEHGVGGWIQNKQGFVHLPKSGLITRAAIYASEFGGGRLAGLRFWFAGESTPVLIGRETDSVMDVVFGPASPAQFTGIYGFAGSDIDCIGLIFNLPDYE
jgi:hypothetical protein